jgi:hypothetical protein
MLFPVPRGTWQRGIRCVPDWRTLPPLTLDVCKLPLPVSLLHSSSAVHLSCFVADIEGGPQVVQMPAVSL